MEFQKEIARPYTGVAAPLEISSGVCYSLQGEGEKLLANMDRVPHFPPHGYHKLDA
jgi:hypothetical protein